jgi:NhaP-type Na+/H+ and K+/H+ antiporter
MAIADMIVVAFFSLLRPGENTGTLFDDAAFKIEGISLYVQGHKLDFAIASGAEIKASTSTSASYTFTTHKNNNRNTKVVHGFRGDTWCCLVKAAVRRMLHRHIHKSRCTVPCTSYYQGNRKTLAKVKEVTEVLRNEMWISVHRNYIEA